MDKIEVGKKYLMRNGSTARVIATDRVNSDGRSISGLYLYNDNEWAISWRADGSASATTSRDESDFDIVKEIKPKEVGYMNVYPSSHSSHIAVAEIIWPTRAKADDVRRSKRLACIRVEFEEGQFDD